MAVLLSSLFCYNQMGGIDEPRSIVSLVTEMTKHIRVRSETQGRGGVRSSAPSRRRSCGSSGTFTST